MTDALMPCPFCGSEEMTVGDHRGVEVVCTVQCAICGAEKSMCSPRVADARAMAIAAWNTRAPQPGKAEGEGWVACADRLPGNAGRYLCWSDTWLGPCIAHRVLSGAMWLDDESTCPLPFLRMPTHWRPLPTPPARSGEAHCPHCNGAPNREGVMYHNLLCKLFSAPVTP